MDSQLTINRNKNESNNNVDIVCNAQT